MNEHEIHDLFHSRFGRPPEVVARAPGRVEFIGNHTDYNGGAVIGAAIDRSVWVAAAASASPRQRFASGADHPAAEVASGDGPLPAGAGDWVRYPRGVWRSLGDFGLPRPDGFDLLVGSNLPAGAGLSSSAALELATALALLELAGHRGIEPNRLAALGRHAENVHVGVPCGILDQGTSAFGRAGHLVHIDCRGPRFSLLPLPAGACFWIFNTLEKHALVDGLYSERHRECLAAAAGLGVAWLTDFPADRAGEIASKLAPVLARRARHIIGEHARVAETAAALRAADLAGAGRLLAASHESSRDLFENSTPALDSLVDLLCAAPGVFGARLTGGGFGGAVLALTEDSFAADRAAAIAAAHAARGHGQPEVIQLRTGDGARVAWRAGT